MKKYLIYLFTLSFVMAACSEDPNDVVITDTDGSLTIDLSGDMNKKYEDDSLVAYTHGTYIIIRAFDIEKNDMWILLESSKVENVIGTHEVGRSDEPVQINFNYADGSHHLSSESGSVTISEYDDSHIKGTFSFEAKDFSATDVTISGTNGEFTAIIK
jgi:hypothetical protein